jgi:hypothetical protein
MLMLLLKLEQLPCLCNVSHLALQMNRYKVVVVVVVVLAVPVI